MIWIFRILFVVLWLILYDFILGVTGLLFSRFSYARHPRLHKFGLRRLAMSELFGKKFLPHRCELCCSTEKCGNWTCEKYHQKVKKVP